MFRKMFLALLLASATLPAVAASTDRQPASQTALSELEEKLRQHPEVQAYIHRAESSRLQATGELGLPDPMLFVQEQDYPLGSSRSQDQEEKMLGFKQTLPAFGTRSAKSEKSFAEEKKTKLQGAFAFAGMKAKLIQTLADWQRIQEQMKILAEQSEVLRSEQASLRGRIAANQSSSSQLAMSRADSTDIQLIRTDLEEEQHEMMAILTNMLGEAPNIVLPSIAMLPWRDNPEATYPVKIAAADIDMAHKDVDLREAEFNPSVEFQSSYGRMRNGDNAGTVMLGLSIPLWAKQSQKPKLAGAKAGLRAAETDKDNIQRQILEKMSHLEARIAASEIKINLLQSKESLLRASGNAQTREYEAGKTEFAMPLKTRREMLSVRYQLAAERAKRTALIADFNHYIVQGESE